MLLANGADVNAKREDGFTALMWASGGGYTEIVKLLLANGADVNAKTEDGNTALMSASGNGHTETVKLLIDAGADLNMLDKSSLFGVSKTALDFASNEEIKKLLEKAMSVRKAGAK